MDGDGKQQLGGAAASVAAQAQPEPGASPPPPPQSPVKTAVAVSSPGALQSPLEQAAAPAEAPRLKQCPACGVEPLTDEEMQIVRKPGRRSSRDMHDPRNRPENLVTKDFLKRHILQHGMSLRDIGMFHGYTISTLSRRAKQENVMVGAHARQEAANRQFAAAAAAGAVAAAAMFNRQALAVSAAWGTGGEAAGQAGVPEAQQPQDAGQPRQQDTQQQQDAGQPGQQDAQQQQHEGQGQGGEQGGGEGTQAAVGAKRPRASPDAQPPAAAGEAEGPAAKRVAAGGTASRVAAALQQALAAPSPRPVQSAAFPVLSMAMRANAGLWQQQAHKDAAAAAQQQATVLRQMHARVASQQHQQQRDLWLQLQRQRQQEQAAHGYNPARQPLKRACRQEPAPPLLPTRPPSRRRFGLQPADEETAWMEDAADGEAADETEAAEAAAGGEAAAEAEAAGAAGSEPASVGAAGSEAADDAEAADAEAVEGLVCLLHGGIHGSRPASPRADRPAVQQPTRRQDQPKQLEQEQQGQQKQHDEPRQQAVEAPAAVQQQGCSAAAEERRLGGSSVGAVKLEGGDQPGQDGQPAMALQPSTGDQPHPPHVGWKEEGGSPASSSGPPGGQRAPAGQQQQQQPAQQQPPAQQQQPELVAAAAAADGARSAAPPQLGAGVASLPCSGSSVDPGATLPSAEPGASLPGLHAWTRLPQLQGVPPAVPLLAASALGSKGSSGGAVAQGSPQLAGSSVAVLATQKTLQLAASSVAVMAAQKTLQRALQAFQDADPTRSSTMLRPLRLLLLAGKGGATLEDVVTCWDSLDPGKREDLFNIAVLVASKGCWERLDINLQLELTG